MILTVTLNPSVDRAIYLQSLLVGDTNRVLRTETDAGGKGINLSRIADELGAQTLATGFLGGGPGAYVRTVLDRERVPHEFVEIEGETRINFSVEDASGGPPTTFNERGPTLSGADWDRLLEVCERRAVSGGWACLGGSIPPGLPQDAYRTLGEFFKARGCRVLLDADGDALRVGLEAGPDLIKPNTKEAERLLGKNIGSDADAVSAARELVGHGVPTVILSRGAQGAVLANAEEVWLGHSPQVQERSSIGSGDSMLGAYLWAIEAGMQASEALQWGLAAGAATAESSGAEIGRQPEIERLVPLARVEPIERIDP